jgi:hypothetical protein
MRKKPTSSISRREEEKKVKAKVVSIITTKAIIITMSLPILSDMAPKG